MWDYRVAKMKIAMKTLVWVGVAGLFLCSPAFAKKEPLNLSAFKGKYKGTMTLVGPGGSSSGTAKVIVKVPRNGKSATIDYAATVSDGMGGSSVLPTVMTLAANKTMSVTDLGVGIAGTNNAKPGTGAWTQRKRKMTFNATNGDMVLLCTAVAKDVRRKRKLKMTLTSTDAGGSTVFTNTLKARLPKPKK